MDADLKKLLEDILAEQKEISLYTLTLERDRLFGALIEAGLGVPVVTAIEFVLASGATSTVFFPIPPGTVALMYGPVEWFTSLPWWCSYSFWVDTTAPAIPLGTAIRMPAEKSFDFRGIYGVRAFTVHQVTNLHVAQTAYVMVVNLVLSVSTETWNLIKAVYLDALVERLRKKAIEISGIPR